MVMLHFGSGVLRDSEPEAGGGGQGALFDDPNTGHDQDAAPKSSPDDDRFAKLEKKLDEQSGFLANFFQRPQQQRQQPQQNPEDQKKRFEEAFFQNPAAFSAHLANQAAHNQANQLRGELHPMQVKLAQQEVRGKDTEVYDKYKTEIAEWVSSTYTNPGDWTNPFVWEQALNRVKAEKLDEIAQMRAEKKKAAAAINAPSRAGYRGEEQKGLSDEEKQMADFLGMSYSDYEDARKGWNEDMKAPTSGRRMTESGWSNVITLDSRKPRKARKTA